MAHALRANGVYLRCLLSHVWRRWSSDNSLTGRFSRWERYTANGQPDNACDDVWSVWDGVSGCVPGEDCVQASFESNGDWNDEHCMFPRPFVCSDT